MCTLKHVYVFMHVHHVWCVCMWVCSCTGQSEVSGVFLFGPSNPLIALRLLISHWVWSSWSWQDLLANELRGSSCPCCPLSLSRLQSQSHTIPRFLHGSKDWNSHLRAFEEDILLTEQTTQSFICPYNQHLFGSNKLMDASSVNGSTLNTASHMFYSSQLYMPLTTVPFETYAYIYFDYLPPPHSSLYQSYSVPWSNRL